MKSRTARIIMAGLMAVAWWTGPGPAEAGVPDRDVQRITEAAPSKATARPKRPRRLLVFNLCKGFRHKSIPWGAKALEIMGRKTGAYETVSSKDISMFEPDSLRRFDAVCMNNTTRELFGNSPEAERLKKSLLEFVRGGKGIVGVHAATDAFYKWPEYGEMMGGYFWGHPWGSRDTVTIKIDEPDHPRCAAFEGKGFEITEEMYQFKDPYSRERLRVLMTIDLEKTRKKGGKRKDNDYAVSWVRSYGKGRVFYCSLGHNNHIFWHPAILRHYLDGIQFAMGDLQADATPSAAAGGAASTSAAGAGAGTLKKLIGTWKGRVDKGATGHHLTITADRIVGTIDGRRSLGEGSFKLDPTTKPWRMDATGTKGSHKGDTFLGICSVQGDTLKWCVGSADERPTEFATADGNFLLVLKRR